MPPRATLSRERIVDAAVELVDTEGIDALSLRRLGSSLGAHPTSMYRYFRKKEDLLRAVVDKVLAAVVPDLDPDAPWRTSIRKSCISLRNVSSSGPSPTITTRTPGTPSRHARRCTCFSGARRPT